MEVTVEKTFTLESTDNKPDNVLLNPENVTRSNIAKAFRIRIYANNSEKNILLIGSFYSYDRNCAVLEDVKLIILMDDTVTVVCIEECKILKHEKFSDFGCYFSIYKFQGGYIIQGELEIVKLDKYLNKEWDFSGADIFVTQDENKAF